MTSFKNYAINEIQNGSTPREKLPDAEWCQLVKQLSELNTVDFEALVMAVRLRGRLGESLKTFNPSV